MTYPFSRRERAATLRAVRDRIPVDCLLCRSRTAGGLCAECRQAVCASMSQPRCVRCDLLLPSDAGACEPAVSGASGDQADSVCADCKVLSPAFERVVAAFDYAWPGEILIQRLKQQGQFGCAPILSRLIVERCHDMAAASPSAAVPRWRAGAVVVPVPAGRRSLRLRGFNAAAELGRDFASRMGLEWRPEWLTRVREGEGQKHLGRESRRESVQGLYAGSAAVAGREVVVVDDVMTTGSTLDAIARVLKEQGASAVWAVVAARTPSFMSFRPG